MVSFTTLMRIATEIGFSAPSPVARNQIGRGSKMAKIPDVILIHGAWADGSSWAKVIQETAHLIIEAASR